MHQKLDKKLSVKIENYTNAFTKVKKKNIELKMEFQNKFLANQDY